MARGSYSLSGRGTSAKRTGKIASQSASSGAGRMRLRSRALARMKRRNAGAASSQTAKPNPRWSSPRRQDDQLRLRVEAKSGLDRGHSFMLTEGDAATL